MKERFAGPGRGGGDIRKHEITENTETKDKTNAQSKRAAAAGGGKGKVVEAQKAEGAPEGTGARRISVLHYECSDAVGSNGI